MDIISLLIGLIVGAVLALAAYILIRRSVLKGKSNEILEKAEIEGEKIKNERFRPRRSTSPSRASTRRPSMRRTPRSATPRTVSARRRTP